MFDAKKFLLQLAARGVQEIVICAGARNAEFVQTLEVAKNVKLYHFFEERSASFFALARARASGRPVAVITTSGTAVAELLPAAIEAFYQQVPLYFVTADRPKKFRGTGAPQAIHQSKLLQEHVSMVVDTAKNPDFDWSRLLPGSSAHFNIALPEPNEHLDIQSWDWPQIAMNSNSQSEEKPSQQRVEQKNDSLKKKISEIKKPVVIIGGLDERERGVVKEALKQFDSSCQLPLVVEGPSGLRVETPGLIKVPDIALPELVRAHSIDSVIRIGSVPTLRFWRDLELEFKHLPVLNFSKARWTGLSRVQERPFSLSQLNGFLKNNFFEKTAESKTAAEAPAETLTEKENLSRAQDLSLQLDKLLAKFPKSEPAFFRAVSLVLQESENEPSVYVGNSLPIREWDLCADFSRCITVVANRGANGIDGQVSSFIGSDCAVAIFGDLTTMYDLSAPWALKYSEKRKVIFVVNNNGGQIFARKFSQKSFLNQHQIDFSHWAKMWQMDYHLAEPEVWQDLNRFVGTGASTHFGAGHSRHKVIEVKPCLEQTTAFWKAYKELSF